MFCPECGKDNPDTNQFCGVCGAITSINKEKCNKKKSWNLACKIVGLVSLFGGFGILLVTYANPVIDLFGVQVTLAQLNSYCSVTVGNASSGVSCMGVHNEFHNRCAVGILLLISGLIEVILS